MTKKGEEWSFGKQRRDAREKLPEEYDGKLSTIWNQDSSEEFGMNSQIIVKKRLF
ncbi:hypothetical protein L1F28_24715 [Arthrospira platensis NCB002]|uniref:hypothetical protein n=1 Tax=Limnospira platensis TaxID=118562 RepID=UPI0029767B84|nr:hypothetical protein [Arthrospira platensis NCB002]